MIEVKLNEDDRLDWALKTFKRKVQKSGLLQDLRREVLSLVDEQHDVAPFGARLQQEAVQRVDRVLERRPGRGHVEVVQDRPQQLRGRQREIHQITGHPIG